MSSPTYLTVAVASSALFDLSESDKIFKENGEQGYRIYQREHEKDPLKKGVAFAFVQKLLRLNSPDFDFTPVQVVLLSRNSPSTGVRIMNSLEHHNLKITRAAFTEGASPWPYMRSFGAHLFLTENEEDVLSALENNIAAGRISGGKQVVQMHDSDTGLRLAFDFDGILASDEAETIFQEKGLQAFETNERKQVDTPLERGPLADFFTQIAALQSAETKLAKTSEYTPQIRTALVTARGPRAFMRAVMSLRTWGVEVNEAFFLSGMDKSQVLSTFAPHIFFDDSLAHIERAQEFVPSVHVPYGVNNRAKKEP